jgi:hypothetical protein
MGYHGGQTPTGWPHTCVHICTAQSSKPDCRDPEAKPRQRDAPNTPIPGGAQCPDEKGMGVKNPHTSRRLAVHGVSHVKG